MGCYYSLCHNTYAFLSYFTRFTWRGRMTGSWNSGLENEQILETYSAQLQKSWNSTEVNFGINKKYWAEKILDGGYPPSTRVGDALPPWARPLPRGPPGRPPMPIFCYMKSFTLEKIISKLSGRDTAATRRNLGGTNLGLQRSCSAGETSPREGVNLHQHLHQHHLLSNPSSSLVSNLCPKSSDWYLWVASSVDYSL